MRLLTRDVRRWGRCCFVLALLRMAAAAAEESAVAYGPPASPLSWKVIDSEEGGDSSSFTARRDYLGFARKPTSVTLAEFRDERPYGAPTKAKVWLARFDSVLIDAPGKVTRTISISLAFDASTRDLLCAFTDPSPVWAQGAKGSVVEAKFAAAGRVTSPAHYNTLASSVVAVLTEAAKSWGLDPAQQGQVILRPRFADFRYTQEPACNVWIVESIGKYVMTRYPPPSVGRDSTSSTRQQGFVLTTKVDAYRDGDLKFVGGLIYF